MSKDIWHTADEIPVVERYRIIETSDNRYYLNNTDSRPLSLINRWCYLDDLIACEQELIRTRKALDYAIDVIQTVAKMSDKLSREYGESLVEQLDNIQAYCWQEGYVLTHEEDLSKALEQKDE